MTGKKSFVMRLLSWVHDILIFEGIYMLAAGTLHVRGQEVPVFLAQGIALAIPLVLTDIVVLRCKSLLLFCLFSAALTWGMKLVFGYTLTAGLTVFVCLFRCYVKLRQGEIKRKMRELPGEAGAQENEEVWEVSTLLDSPNPMHCLLFALLYLGLVALGCRRLLLPMLGLMAAESGVCLAYCYLDRLSEFAKKNRYVANLPVNAMRRNGAGILWIGAAALFLFMTPAFICHEEPLTKLKFELQQSEDTGGGESYEEVAGTDHMMEELMRLKAKAKKTPAWMKAASKLVSFLLLLWIAYMTLRMVISAVRRAMESFSDDGEDEIIFLGKEEEEIRKGLKAELKKERWSSPDRKIRRLYKKAVKRRIKEGIRGSETPSELEAKAGLYFGKGSPAGQNFYIAHELYEKARYGKTACTKEEVKQCMHIFSNSDR